MPASRPSTAPAGCSSCAADDGTWGVPGGGVEAGETWADTARRECREEAGWDVEITGLLGAYSDPATQTVTRADGCLVQLVGVVFLAALLRRTDRPDHAEVLETGFFDPLALPAPLFGPDRPVLADLAARPPLPVIE